MMVFSILSSPSLQRIFDTRIDRRWLFMYLESNANSILLAG